MFQHKCEQYWPDHGSKQYGDIRIELRDIEQLADFTVRKFEITKVSFPQTFIRPIFAKQPVSIDKSTAYSLKCLITLLLIKIGQAVTNALNDCSALCINHCNSFSGWRVKNDSSVPLYSVAGSWSAILRYFSIGLQEESTQL